MTYVLVDQVKNTNLAVESNINCFKLSILQKQQIKKGHQK